MADTRTDEEKAKECEKTLNVLQQIRLPYEEMVDNIIIYVDHSRRRIKDTESTRGKQTGTDVYDGTALTARNMLADGIHGYMCASSLHWFDFTLPGKMNFPRASGMRQWTGKRMDEYPDVKQWLDDAEEVVYSAYQRSNFYDQDPSYIRDACTSGTATFLIEEDTGKARTIYTLPHFRECFIAENVFGEVDTNYRVYKLTLLQLIQKFGMDRMKEVIPTFDLQHKQNPYQEWEVLHAVYPRSNYDPSLLNGANRPFASLWILRSPLKLIQEDGYYDNPYVTWRWRKNNDEWYGRSPSWDCYVDIVLANQQSKTNLIAGHKMANPAMVTTDDMRGLVQSGPGGWTFVTDINRQMPKPLTQDIKLPYAVDQQERTDKKIREHYHVDFFLMLYQAAFNKVDLTATQVVGMQGEQAAILGTRIGQFQSEGLNRIMDRQFSIELRAGRIPDVPQILADLGGQSIEIDYLGPLAQSQKRIFQFQGIRSGIAVATEVAALFPEALDNIDPDKTIKDAMESVGFPIKDLRDEDVVAKIRMVRQKQIAMQQMAELATKIGKASQSGGKAAEPGSPVAALMGGQGEGGGQPAA